MAVIHELSNSASVTFGGAPVRSNAVLTTLRLAPTIVKTVDKAVALIGETLTYTITITNLDTVALTDLPFTDILPQGTAYVANSFQVNGVAATPVLSGNTLTYTIPTIAPAATAAVTLNVTVVGGSGVS